LSKREILTNLLPSVAHLDRQNDTMVSRTPSVDAQVGERCVLTYHEILPSASEYLYRVSPAQFQEHLAFFASLALRTASAIQPPLITFDDGHRSNFEQAFPLLEQFGLKATFFVVVGAIDNNDRYITWKQARKLVAAGHSVESHGWSHRILTQCNPSDLHQELIQSKQELENRLGEQVVAISAPGGRWDERVVDVCSRAGYKYLFHSNPWVPASRQKNICLQGRHMVMKRMGSTELQKLLQPGEGQQLYSLIRHKTKERARRILGDQLYHKVWCWLANWKPEEGMEVQIVGSRSQKGNQA
jgi:peptidoglycan/xylan/chitin deacetylase (PgdA/CDA1 family)